MRADRLVATLLVLQAKGRVTAAELADELEVSVEDARRDLEALAIAGIPVYSQPGKGGGWSLLGGARTDLSGLTAAEARTLFMIAGPSSTATPEAKAALRKLVQALPETFRADAEAAASAIVLDPAGWGGTATPDPHHLDVLQQAVIDGVQVRLAYADRTRSETERTVHPLGLVEKGSVWYLVADTDAGLRTFRVSRVRGRDGHRRSGRPPGGLRPGDRGSPSSTRSSRDARRTRQSSRVRLGRRRAARPVRPDGARARTSSTTGGSRSRSAGPRPDARRTARRLGRPPRGRRTPTRSASCCAASVSRAGRPLRRLIPPFGASPSREVLALRRPNARPPPRRPTRWRPPASARVVPGGPRGAASAAYGYASRPPDRDHFVETSTSPAAGREVRQRDAAAEGDRRGSRSSDSDAS